MCDQCFNNEFLSFSSQKEFEKFDLVLTKKISKGHIELVDEDGIYLKHGVFIYLCTACDQWWYLSVPENAWRGFFLFEDQAKKKIEKLAEGQKKRQLGCIVLLVIIVVAIVYWMF